MFYTRLNPEARTLTRLRRLFCNPILLSGIIIGITITCFLFLVIQPKVTTDSNSLDLKSLNLAQHKNNDNIYINTTHQDTDVIHSMLNKTVAHILYQQVRILCWVTTSPDNHEKRARHVKATWGRRCNILIFISTKEDDELPTVAFPIQEGRDYLWEKTKKALLYLFSFYYEQADWFLKADDDTYVIVENLRYMLYTANPDDSVYYGCRFKPFVPEGYMSGGAGYVLSREALRKVVTQAMPNKTLCREGHGGSEDVEMGKCLQAIGIKPGDSRDEEGRMRFMPLNVRHFMIPGSLPKDSWFWKYLYYPIEEGLGCCSDVAVSIHYVKPEEMYLFDYFLYHLRPFGIGFEPKLPERNATLSAT